MTKYKYSRKKWFRKHGMRITGLNTSKAQADAYKDLLATLPEKECQHNNILDTEEDFECMDCGKSLKVKPSPSPVKGACVCGDSLIEVPSLDGIEEIEEMPIWSPLDQEKGCINDLGKAINFLISNQRIIIKALKEKHNE